MLTVNEVRLDDPGRCYIIAEASGNHAQDYAKAEALVVAAAESGADAIKFQTYTSEEICADVPLVFGYDAIHDNWLRSLDVTTMRQLFTKGGLPRAWHAPLKKLADSLGITFLSTPFSVDAARFLVDEVGVPALKIASFDLTFTPLLEYAASTGNPVLLSTGGATLDEIWQAIEGPLQGIDDRLVLLHCMALYPCPTVDANLRAMQALQCFDCPVGWSDHTLSVELIPALAVTQGATVIEKHIRLAGDSTSVDAGHALTPPQFKQMVEAVRHVPAILGSSVKEPHPREMHERLWARRDPSDWLRPMRAAREGAWE